VTTGGLPQSDVSGRFRQHERVPRSLRQRSEPSDPIEYAGQARAPRSASDVARASEAARIGLSTLVDLIAASVASASARSSGVRSAVCESTCPGVCESTCPEAFSVPESTCPSACEVTCPSAGERPSCSGGKGTNSSTGHLIADMDFSAASRARKASSLVSFLSVAGALPSPSCFRSARVLTRSFSVRR